MEGWHFEIRRRAEQLGELGIELNQLLSDVLALGVVRLEDFWLGVTSQDKCQLLGQVVRVLHAYVHAGARFWRVRVAGVAEEEDTAAIGEGLDDTLGDGVPAHPLDMHDGHFVGIEDVWDAALENVEDSGAVLA